MWSGPRRPGSVAFVAVGGGEQVGREARVLRHHGLRVSAHFRGFAQPVFLGAALGALLGQLAQAREQAAKPHGGDARATRRGDLDGRGNLTEAGLSEWIEFFLSVCAEAVMQTKEADYTLNPGVVYSALGSAAKRPSANSARTASRLA